jgi:hypothetical protein
VLGYRTKMAGSAEETNIGESPRYAQHTAGLAVTDMLLEPLGLSQTMKRLRIVRL